MNANTLSLDRPVRRRLERLRGAAGNAFGTCEQLERRDLLTAHAVAEYFPLDSSSTWHYAGTLNGHSMTAVTTASTGNVIAGTPTFKFTTVLTPDAGGTATTDSRNFANTTDGIRFFRQDDVQPSLTTHFNFGDGLVLLPASVSDGQVIHFDKSLTGTSSGGRSWSGNITGDMTIVGIDTIDTTAGSFQALKISLDSTINETGSTGWTASGRVAETRWLVRGVGTVRMDYVSALSFSDQADQTLLINMGLTSASRLGSVTSFTVTGQGANIPFGDTNPNPGDGTNFAGIPVSTGFRDRTFVITNTGSGPINLVPGSRGFLSITGPQGPEFVVVQQPNSTIGPGETTSFIIRLDPAGSGFRNATVSFATDDNTAHPFTFAIRGNGLITGAIRVRGGAAHGVIVNNATSPLNSNGTRFGQKHAAGNASVTRTFIISNIGAGSLALHGSPLITISGPNAADFSLTLAPARTVAHGATTTFKIKFNPTDLGIRTATITILTNDPANPTFTFTIVGTGT